MRRSRLILVARRVETLRLIRKMEAAGISKAPAATRNLETVKPLQYAETLANRSNLPSLNDEAVVNSRVNNIQRLSLSQVAT